MDSAALRFDGDEPLGFLLPQPVSYSKPITDRLATSERAEMRWLLPRPLAKKHNIVFRKFVAAQGVLVAYVDLYQKETSADTYFTSQVSLVGHTQDLQWVTKHDSAVSGRSHERLLPVVGDFVPSTALTELWFENVRTLQADSNVKHEFFTKEPISLKALTVDLKAIIEKSFSSLANKARYNGIDRMELVRNLSFSPAAEIALVERLYLIPSRSAGFFELLARELSSFLRASGSVTAVWGELRPTTRGVEFFLAQPTDAVSSKRNRARVVDP